VVIIFSYDISGEIFLFTLLYLNITFLYKYKFIIIRYFCKLNVKVKCSTISFRNICLLMHFEKKMSNNLP